MKTHLQTKLFATVYHLYMFFLEFSYFANMSWSHVSNFRKNIGFEKSLICPRPVFQIPVKHEFLKIPDFQTPSAADKLSGPNLGIKYVASSQATHAHPLPCISPTATPWVFPNPLREFLIMFWFRVLTAENYFQWKIQCYCWNTKAASCNYWVLSPYRISKY